MALSEESSLRDAMERCLNHRTEGDGLKGAKLMSCFSRARVQASAYGLTAGRKGRALSVAYLSDGKRSVLLGFKWNEKGTLDLRDAWKIKYVKKVHLRREEQDGLELKLTFETRRGSSAVSASFERDEDARKCAAWILHACRRAGRKVPKIQGIGPEEEEAWLEELENSKTSHSNDEMDEYAMRQGTVPERQVGKDASEGWTNSDLHDTKVAEEEEKDLNQMLEYYNLDAGDLETLEETLRAELKALEVANVHEILQANESTETLLRNVESALAQVDDLDAWLETFHVKLKHMRSDVAAIEAKNNELQTQASNNRRLLDALEDLQEILSVSKDDIETLVDAKLSEENLPEIVYALESLEEALDGIAGKHTSFDASYLEMRAVQDHLAYLSQVKQDFLGKTAPFLRQEIDRCVEMLIPPPEHRHSVERWQNLVATKPGIFHFTETYKPLVEVCSRLSLPFRKQIINHFSSTLGEFLKRAVMSIIAGSPDCAKSADVDEMCGKIRSAFQVVQDITLKALEFLNREQKQTNNAPGIPRLSEPTEYYAAVQRIHLDLDKQTVSAMGRYLAQDRTFPIPLVGHMEMLLADMDVCMASLILSCKDQLKQTFYEYVRAVQLSVGDSLPDNAVDKNNLNGMPESASSALELFRRLKVWTNSLSLGETQTAMIDNACVSIAREVIAIANKIASALPANKERTYIEAHYLLWDSLKPLEKNSVMANQYAMDSAQDYRKYLALVRTKFAQAPIFKEMIELAEKLEKYRDQGIPDEEIPFQMGTSSSELREILQIFGSATFEKKAKALHVAVEKSFMHNPALQKDVWKAICDLMKERYSTLALMKEKCYPKERLPLSVENFCALLYQL